MRDPVRTVLTPEGWKLNWSPRGEHELYHLGEDPFETRNLVHAHEYGGVVQGLTAEIRDWQERTGELE